MRRVTLLFPDVSRLADFLFTNRIKKADVASAHLTLTAELSEKKILCACADYGAEIKREFFAINISVS